MNERKIKTKIGRKKDKKSKIGRKKKGKIVSFVFLSFFLPIFVFKNMIIQQMALKSDKLSLFRRLNNNFFV